MPRVLLGLLVLLTPLAALAQPRPGQMPVRIVEAPMGECPPFQPAHQRPGVRLHRASLVHGGRSPAELAKQVTGLVEAVLSDPLVDIQGVGILVRASDAQLERITAQEIALVQYADELDYAMGVDVRTAPRLAKAPKAPRGWELKLGAGENPVWIVAFDAPLMKLSKLDAQLDSVEVENLGLEDYSAGLFRMSREMALKVEKLPGVSWVGLYEPLYKVPPTFFGKSPDCGVYPADLERMVRQRQIAADQARVTVDIELFGEYPSAELRKLLPPPDEGGFDGGGSLHVTVPRSSLRLIARLAEVRSIGPLGVAAPAE